jgi:peptide/nickel transport system permease protein
MGNQMSEERVATRGVANDGASWTSAATPVAGRTIPAPLASAAPRLGSFGLVWRSFRRHPAGMIGSVVTLALIAIAVVGPRFTRYDPDELIMTALMAPPSVEHPLGTDQFGRDILTRIVHGARYSLRIGLISVAIGAAIGGAAGLIAGYFGRWADGLIMRLIDVQLAFPSILLAMGIVSVLGPSLENAMIAVGISSIPGYTRVMRSSVLTAKELSYVEAAHSLGCRHIRIMFRHILPNVVAPMIVMGTLGVANAILTASGLSFIGLGAQPPTPEWGAMLNDGRQYLTKAWWIATFPGLAIMLAVLAINMIGDGLRDALDPRLRV